MESVVYYTVKMKFARICIIYFSMPTPPTSPTLLHMTKHSRITTYRSQSGKVNRDIFFSKLHIFTFSANMWKEITGFVPSVSSAAGGDAMSD